MAEKKLNPRVLFLLMMILVLAVLFLPTTMIIFFGMMPTWAIMASDRSRGKLRSLGVGFINFAGVSYVLMGLWHQGHNFDNAAAALMNAENLIVMYVVAGIGFAVQRSLSGIVATLILEQTKNKYKKSKERLQELEERWGREVNGRVPLDSYGFPIETELKK